MHTPDTRPRPGFDRTAQAAPGARDPGDIRAARLANEIKNWGRACGFQGVGISGVSLAADEARLLTWLDAGRHGEMDYMARHGVRRSRPDALVPGTVSVICARMDYLPASPHDAEQLLNDRQRAYVARYALGRDYHKVVRRRLQKLADRITRAIGPFAYRVFSDSAPVLEKPLARNAGLGWIGKHTNLLAREAGSWFFLGELYTDLALPTDSPRRPHCGRCDACIKACPTGAIIAPYQLDARRCIAYLTIELHGSIPLELRPLIGNRVFGCDDCQLVCPWNRYAQATPELDFVPRNGLDDARLVDLFAWSEAQFLERTAGTALRRLGHPRWLRNIAVALGNAAPQPLVLAALRTRAAHPSAVVREHVAWAIARQQRGP